MLSISLAIMHLHFVTAFFSMSAQFAKHFQIPLVVKVFQAVVYNNIAKLAIIVIIVNFLSLVI